MTDLRHAEADTTPVTIEASDAIDAAGALIMMARANRREAKLRRNSGGAMASQRRSLRKAADVYEAAASRIQAAADARWTR